jgi:outer membrane protein assembly factor BamB
MALQTLGTNANNSLTALVWKGMVAGVDASEINELILNDFNARFPRADISGSGGFVKEGILYVPNRGSLTLFPGDVVAVDAASGTVILVTARGIAAGPWTLT